MKRLRLLMVAGLFLSVKSFLGGAMAVGRLEGVLDEAGKEIKAG